MTRVAPLRRFVATVAAAAVWTTGHLAALSGCASRTAASPANDDGGDASSGAVASSSETPHGTSTTPPSDSSGAPDDTGAPVPTDPCGEADPTACADGCAQVVSYQIEDLETCAVTTRSRCLTGERTRTPAAGRTFYLGDEFVAVGSYCGSWVDVEGPWQECTLDGTGDPRCGCFCREGVCPGDEDYLALSACELPQLCPTVEAGVIGLDAGDPSCVLGALAARTPGALEAIYSTGFVYERTVIHLDGTDDALVVQGRDDSQIDCIEDLSVWRDAQRCTLAAPAVFEACAAETDEELLSQCFEASQVWFTSCRPAEPAC